MGADRFVLPVDKLRWICDPNAFPFECTADLAPSEEFIGQERGIRSIEFGLAVESTGYNLFVTGLSGTGKASAIRSYLERAVARRQAEGIQHEPDDWCYVHNMADPDRPRALRLPRGQGRNLRTRVDGLLRALKDEIPRAFASEDYREQRKKIVEERQRQSQQLIQQTEQEAHQQGFAVQLSPMGVAVIPQLEGRPMTEQEFYALPEEARTKISEGRSTVLEQMERAFDHMRDLEREGLTELQDLDRRVGEFTLRRLFAELAREHEALPQVITFLEELRQYTLDNLEHFRTPDAPAPAPTPPNAEARPLPQNSHFLPFQVNLFVDNSQAKGPPIILEVNPTWSNLFGRIERRAFMGTYLSDHTMLRPGAFHVANQGYLVLNIRDVLLSPGVWEGLKRALRNKEVRLEDPAEQFGFVAPSGLRPQPIPLDVKVAVIGDEYLYQMLSTLDEDFWELFKVKADFDYQIDRTPENIGAYCAVIAGICQHEGLRHFQRGAAAKVLEYGARLVADQEKLSSRFGQIRDILVEASHWATLAGSELVMAEHVMKAIEEKVYRSSLIADRITRLIAEGTLMVDVEGAVVGQVNGLAVYELGDISFGRPSRITARTFTGRRGLINIERESQLSGRIHDKGVLIIGGYLGSRYAQDKPLSLSASVCFEQSYEGVEGDSASSTELYAIVSALSELPIDQSIAVTGSVNQKGEVQPIGGVNQKIEGYFEVCRAKGLTGHQGVMIPRQNRRHLMLREDVVEAVRQGQFHIWEVGTIDEGIEILTGKPAGERQPDGAYPEGTVNYLANKRLWELAELLRLFEEGGEEEAEAPPS